MLKLWGRINSINVQKVLWTLAELNVAYERTDAGLQFGVVNEPFYRRMNPNAACRRSRTTDSCCGNRTQSCGISRRSTVRHALAERSPATRRRRSLMDWTTSTVAPALTPVFWGLIRTPPEKRNMASIEAEAEKVGQAFKVLEHSLEGRDHVAGKSFTMGDIPLGTFVHRWYALA